MGKLITVLMIAVLSCVLVLCVSADGITPYYAISSCPECGGMAAYSCGGLTGFYAPDENCSLHDPCVRMNRAQASTFVTCRICGYGTGGAHGNGQIAPHIESEYHTYTRSSYTICVYN